MRSISVIISNNPSKLAASTVYAARCTLKKTSAWTETLKHHTGYSEDQVRKSNLRNLFLNRDCAKSLVNLHVCASESRLKTIFRKYEDHEHGEVALFLWRGVWWQRLSLAGTCRQIAVTDSGQISQGRNAVRHSQIGEAVESHWLQRTTIWREGWSFGTVDDEEVGRSEFVVDGSKYELWRRDDGDNTKDEENTVEQQSRSSSVEHSSTAVCRDDKKCSLPGKSLKS
nr:cyclin A/B/D/E [Tanacetum cinerariifolium]